MKEKQQLKFSKQGKKITNQLLDFSYQSRIILENEIIKIPQIIFSIVIILSHTQEISFLFDNYYQSTHSNFDFMLAFVKISKFVRPYQILKQEFYTYSYVIPLIINFLYYFLLLKLFIEFKIRKDKQLKLLNLFYSQSRIFVILMIFLSYIQALLFHLFFTIQVEMVISSISYNSKINQIHIENIILAIITLILVILNMVSYMLCNLESNYIGQQNFGVLKQGFCLYWQQMSMLIIILINQLNTSHNLKFYLILTLLLTRISFQIYSQLNYFISHFIKARIEFFGMASQLLMIFIFLILNLIQLKNEYYDALFFLILFPLLVQIINDQFKTYHNNLMINRKNNFNPNKLQYKIVELFLNFGTVSNSFVKKKQQMVFIYHFKITHKMECQQSLCQCKNSSLSFESIINLYMKEQILIFGEAINLNKDKSAKQSFFLRYIQFINQLGYNIKAFEQLNIQKIYEIDQNSQINLQKSEINYGEPNNSLDQKSYSGQKFLNDQQLNEFNKIKVGKLNIIRQIKLRLISENIKNSMSNAFKKQNNLQENIEHAVNLFIISENGNKKLKQKILMSLNRKRQLFNNLVMNNIKLFTEAKQLLIKLKKIERQLDKLYDQFPSRKMQALSAFFQAEIMNNYFSAYKISMLASISDEKLLKMQSQISLDLFSNKIEYLIFGFDQHCHRLKIQQTSNRIHQFFGYSLEQFISQDFIEFILPQGFHIIHQNLVQNFLQTGESKFFRSINLSFCQTINKFMKPLDFFFDINLASFDDLRFISFLQETQIQSAYLFCCQNNRIQSMTKNIVQKLGVPSKYGQQLVNLLLKQQITKFFPKYHNIYESFITRGSILNKDQFEQTIQDDKQSYFDKSENQIIMNIPELQILENQQKINWNENDHIHQLYVDVVFHLRNVQQDIFEYLIVEIREAKKMTNTELSTPYQTERPLSTNNNLEYLVQQSDFDNNFGIIEDNEIYQINTPQALELDNFDQQIHFGQRLKISHNSQHLYPNISIVLASPKDSTVRLIDDKPEISLQREVNQKVKNLKNKQQNQYFFAQQQKEDQDSSNYISSLRPNQQDENNQLQLVGIDQEVQNRIKLQIQDDNIENNQILQRKQDGSETSSLGDIKKSKYSKKYILIQKIISSPKFSHHFNKMKYILSLLFLNFVIFGLVEVYFLNSDLPQFLKELDLLQIKVNIIGPIDNYIVGQNDVVNYQILVLQKKMTEIEAQKNSIYSVNEINYTFYELKTSFENQLQNPYIDPFFEDRYIDVWMAKYPNLVSYNIRVREAIQLELEAALNFIQIDFLRATNIDFTQGFFAFLFKNYQSLRHLFQNLNEEMLDYSTNRSTLVSKNWHQLLIPILIIGSCLMMASMIFYRIYLQQYDRFLQLFSYIDSVWIQNDIARYRGFVGLLNKNQDVLFKYQFDIETKEKIIQNEEEKKEQQRQNQTQQKEKQNLGFIRLSQKMSYIPSTLTFLLIYGVCFIFCFISNSLGQNYYQKYPETTKFFNLLSDLSMASSGIFSMREISYTIQGNDTIFYFFPEKNASYFIDVFFKHVKVIDNFLEGFAIFDSSNYITSERFVANFYELMKSDICMFLPEYKIFGAQQHCNSALDGVMRNGMIQTLNKVRNQLLNEFEQSNNFSIETINIQSDLEIGLIAYDVLNDLRDQFQNELTNTTNALIQQVLIINITFIILLILCLICLHLVIQPYFQWEFNIVKHFIILLPQASLFLDNQLDRIVRQMIAQEDLI